MITFEVAKKLFSRYFLGPDEILSVISQTNISENFFAKKTIPEIPFSQELLEKSCQDSILILGVPEDRQGKPLTLNNMRSFYGTDPNIKEPCMYNQDWYLKEDFAANRTLEFKWYLIKRSIVENTRALRPDQIQEILTTGEQFPSAILTAYVFFLNYLINKEILWKHDFLWCSDEDHNEDIIYTGRYEDPMGINKNGFNIHRHLKIRNVYGLVPMIEFRQ
ncbi:MAG: hypothetical protein US86_C0001G0148 [Candidatus Daviesbacteria bacterium GW2011_GWA2_38_24]|uniref:Uncharacterized protein n=1 Tax=Candidatus Daviesbacteria bacterium GW2011_GWA2_38_24 TaxID=1618422 RepID=A0A0G0MQN7_9BACT|nr:MAG: hypothetical protein US86_C0001G0148 [Candidatus Daviesbacteria bacterium GW2011_GWA2_38_24]KKQ80637.1 MAG: hypothetical protein UT01_C0008G0009 [Candidatus Daviesbacteria bacterium GW2011_GWA1_38_7]